jgi:Calcineurin-like phosphoesterase
MSIPISRLNAASAGALAIVALALGGAREPETRREPEVQFIHATDPHIFLPSDPKDPAHTMRDKQQDEDEKATLDMFQDLRSRPAAARLAFLVLTGDLGVDPCLIAKDDHDCVGTVDPDQREAEIARLTRIFEASPINDIYIVAGNNDLAHEVAGGPALDYVNGFIDELQRKLLSANSAVQLHNLNRCYAGAATDSSSCYADIAHTSYRLVGFPSYSFKNSEIDDSQTQAAQFEIFRALIDQSRRAGKRALIISHIPDMDDPFFLAQYLFDGKSRARPQIAGDPYPQWFTWNITGQLADAWNRIVNSNAVAAVFAGHLHDPHREVYLRPYTWAATNPGSDSRKLFLAPPLSVKNQDTSPIQARGYSVVKLYRNRIEANLCWYDSQTRRFRPERQTENRP